MENVHLKIATFHYPPFIFLNETENEKPVLFNGIEYLVIRTLQEKLKFSYEIEIPKERHWGIFKDGKWTGITGMVHRKEADIGIGNMMLAAEKYSVVNYTVPFNTDFWVMTFKAPRRLEPGNAFLRPFQAEVWYLVLFSLLISSCVLYLLQRFHSQMYKTQEWSFGNVVWNIMAVFCQESAQLSKLRGCAQGYLLLWIFIAAVLQVSYSGLLIGYLTFPGMEPKIRTLEDLEYAIKYKNVLVGCREGSFVLKIMERGVSNFAFFKEAIYSDPMNLATSSTDGVIRVIQKRYLFISNYFATKYVASMFPKFQLSFSKIFPESYIAIITKQNFNHLSKFNKILRNLFEMGLVDKWKAQIQLQRDVQETEGYELEDLDSPEESIIHSLPLSALLGAFYFLCIGHSFAVVVFISELLLHRLAPTTCHKLRK